MLKNGAMRIVHEIRDEKYLIKSLKNMLPDEDDFQAVEISKNLSILVYFSGYRNLGSGP